MEGTLKETIRSVLEQDFDSFEHIIIDGGSTDKTLQIVNTFSHLVLVSGPDEGIYDAMNKGLEKAKGEWVYFLGADDVLCKNVLNEVFASDLTPYDMLYGDVQNKHDKKKYGGNFSLKKMLRNNICHQAIFTRTQLIKNIGGFNTKYKIAADWDMNIRIMTAGLHKVKYKKLTIAIYNETGFSSMNEDIVFLKDRVKLFQLKLGLKFENDFFTKVYLEEAIFQMKYGSLKQSVRSFVLHMTRNKRYLSTLYTAVAFLKWRLVKQCG